MGKSLAGGLGRYLVRTVSDGDFDLYGVSGQGERSCRSPGDLGRPDLAEVDALQCATGPLGPFSGKSGNSGSTRAGDRERDLECCGAVF